MTNDEINRYIATEIMGLCWHEWKKPEIAQRGGVVVLCKQCGVGRDGEMDGHFNPDYCSDDSPRSLLNEVEAKVIEFLSLSVKNPNVIYCRYLMVANGFSYDDLGYLYEQVIRATAEQRAKACVEAHKEAK